MQFVYKEKRHRPQPGKITYCRPDNTTQYKSQMDIVCDKLDLLIERVMALQLPADPIVVEPIKVEETQIEKPKKITTRLKTAKA